MIASGLWKLQFDLVASVIIPLAFRLLGQQHLPLNLQAWQDGRYP